MAMLDCHDSAGHVITKLLVAERLVCSRGLEPKSSRWEYALQTTATGISLLSVPHSGPKGSDATALEIFRRTVQKGSKNVDFLLFRVHFWKFSLIFVIERFQRYQQGIWRVPVEDLKSTRGVFWSTQRVWKASAASLDDPEGYLGVSAACLDISRSVFGKFGIGLQRVTLNFMCLCDYLWDCIRHFFE